MAFVRMAWFSPFPPVRTGVAACSAELVAALRTRGYLIDIYPEPAAHDFPWIHRQRPYDLVVYQFGNSSHHDYIWAYALTYPGLAVLHDTHLHHARAARLLREGRHDDYRRVLRRDRPDLDADIAELAIAGFDSRLYYDWPMTRSLIERSRLTAVHGAGAKAELLEALAPAGPALADRVAPIRLGHGELIRPERAATGRATVRARYGIAADAIVFGVFGGLTPEKRLPQILSAFRAVRPLAPGAVLLLAGEPPAHYDVRRDLAPGDLAIVTGYLDDCDVTDHIAAVDVSLNLRWPTARETSGPWLRALAAGTPTVITDLRHLAGVPALDPRSWTMTPGSGDAVTVAIDILDEDHSLRLALQRLATDAALRASLGAAGRTYWQREHTIDAMADDYEAIVRRALGLRAADGGRDADRVPDAPDGQETLRALLAPFGIANPLPDHGGAAR